MLTCCPGCATSFRVTPDQLKARAGKVRCGKCQTVFNALDSLIEVAGDTANDTPVPAAAPLVTPPLQPVSATPEPVAVAPVTPAETPPPILPKADIDILLEPPSVVDSKPVAPAEPALGTSEAGEAAHADAEEAAPAEAPASPATVRDRAVAAGLVAARETTEIPGYNKWAEGAFTAPVSVTAPTERPRWPFVVVSFLLLVTLGGQAIHHFRSELSIAMPSLRPGIELACAKLDCDIPLPRHSDLVTIEASDLQVDPAQGGALTLAATLKNRAPYAQAWPLLELTLTDMQDNAVLRRVLQPSEYLPAKADPTLFPPNGETAVRLWLEAKDVVAAGYRLYVFYP